MESQSGNFNRRQRKAGPEKQTRERSGRHDQIRQDMSKVRKMEDREGQGCSAGLCWWRIGVVDLDKCRK